MPINDRIMTMRLPLQRMMYTIFISVYAPTMTNTDVAEEEFYSDPPETIRRVPSDDRLILVGDFNARVGSDTEKWKGVLGSHGVGKCNADGELLLTPLSEYNHTKDYITVRQRDERSRLWY